MPVVSTAITIGAAALSFAGVAGAGAGVMTLGMTVAAGLTGGAIMGAVGYGLYAGTKALMAPKGRGMLPAPTGNAQKELAAAQEAASVKAQAAQQEKQRAISRSRTTYTSPLGPQEEAQTAKKTLLGQ